MVDGCSQLIMSAVFEKNWSLCATSHSRPTPAPGPLLWCPSVTMVFIGTDGHHNSGPGAGVGREWLVAHKDQFFSKTALMINCEHPSTIQTNARPRYQEARGLVWSNTYMAQQWYAGGP